MKSAGARNVYWTSAPEDTLKQGLDCEENARVQTLPGFATPEEAARGSTPAKYVRVIGTVVRGDNALVAQLMNDRPSFEVETVYCSQEADGTWTEGSSGNSTTGFLPTGEGVGTYMAWDEAPEGAVAARCVCRGIEQQVPVVIGCALAVFDAVQTEDEDLALLDAPQIVAWIAADGSETLLPRHDVPAWMRERMRRRIEAIRRSAGSEGDGLQEEWLEIRRRREKPG